MAETPTSVIISTPYPRVSVQPGATVNFDLNVGAPKTQPVSLELSGVPTAWRATLRGGGFVIGGITATPEKSSSATLEVQVPVDARPGAYDLGVRASGADGTSDVAMQITVDEAAESAVSITSDFPEIKGKPTDTFTYSVTIRNNTPEKQVFNFETTGPEGWEVNASPSTESRASTLNLDAGATGTVSVEAKPPASVKAGTYPVTLKVTNKSGQSAVGEFAAVVSGSTSLAMAMSDERVSFSVRSGQNTERTVRISNTGSAPLEGVTLSASPPSDWKVTFSPESVKRIEPGATENVRISVRPGSGALSGDYIVSATASAGTASASTDLRVTVKQSGWWGFAGVALIAVAAVVLWGLFRRFGRR